MDRSIRLLILTALVSASPVFAEEPCPPPSGKLGAEEFAEGAQKTFEALLGSPDTIFPTLRAAIEAKAVAKKPVRTISTGDANYPEFPSYSRCEKTFFRVATINKTVDGIITEEGWKSGWVRREDELKKAGKALSSHLFDAYSPDVPIEDRIIQYVRVKGVPSNFPKHSTIVGVLENPIRTLSVGYHTGYDSGISGNHMRMDEIEVGECAEAPECKSIKPVDSSAVFAERNLKPRYSTEGEWAIDMHVPRSCVVATYRIKFQKVDETCYSDANANCSFKKP